MPGGGGTGNAPSRPSNSVPKLEAMRNLACTHSTLRNQRHVTVLTVVMSVAHIHNAPIEWSGEPRRAKTSARAPQSDDISINLSYRSGRWDPEETSKIVPLRDETS